MHYYFTTVDRRIFIVYLIIFIYHHIFIIVTFLFKIIRCDYFAEAVGYRPRPRLFRGLTSRRRRFLVVRTVFVVRVRHGSRHLSGERVRALQQGLQKKKKKKHFVNESLLMKMLWKK